MTRHRFIWADSLKGWLMLLVVIGHAIQCVLGDACNGNHEWNLIYSFHMPAFMAVSGWLAFKPTIQSVEFTTLFARRFRQLMVPYFAWSIIQYLRRGDYSTDYFLKIILHPDNFFWFLYVLFFIFTIFTGAQFVARKLKLDEYAVIIPLCVVLMGIMVCFEFRLLGFQFIAYYFLFYILGYAIHRTPFLQINSPFLLIILSVIWGCLAWSWSMHNLPSWFPDLPHVPFTLVQYAYRTLTAAIAIAVLMGTAPKLMNSSQGVNMIISHLGKVSLGLYVVHLTFLGYIVDAIVNMYPSITNFVLISLSSILVVILSCVIINLLQKNRYTESVLLGKI